MKLGVIARADNRGIAIQTWEATRHLHPERVLVVREPGAERMGFAYNPDWYPDATVVLFDPARGALPEHEVRSWLTGLDVVYAVETTYDWQFPRWAREQGVATVVHANPEFYRHGGDPNLEPPTAWWTATTWLAERMPSDARVVPMPVATDRIVATDRHDSDQLRILVPVGHQAAADRSGVRLVLDGTRLYPPNYEITIRVQDRRLRHHPAVRSRRYRIEAGGQPDYWSMYAGFDVLLHPRRYGGLSLPANEACAAGLALVMPDCPPNPETWPIVPLACRAIGRPLRSQAGPVPIYNADTRSIYNALESLTDPASRHARQDASLAWASEHSWAALLPVWRAELERAADAVAV